MLYVCKLEYCPENVRFMDILKAHRNLFDLGGDFVRKAVRESMFGKAPFYGRLCSRIGIYSVDNVLYSDPNRHI